MAFENINIGAVPNDGTGDPLRTAFDKVNNNFAQVPLKETGTWTPGIKGANTAGNHTYTTQQGRYVKLGPLVFLWGQITVDTWDSNASGTLLITGLPFNPITNLSGIQSGSVGVYSNPASVPANFGGWLVANAGVNSWLDLKYQNISTGVVSAATTAVAGNGLEIRFSLVFEGS